MITEFTIDRSKWVNGATVTTSNPSMMLNSAGNMCCLGHYAKACGVPDVVQHRKTVPFSLREVLPEEMKWLLHKDLNCSSQHCETLISKNDAHGEFPNRESLIQEVFALHGIAVTFTN